MERQSTGSEDSLLKRGILEKNMKCKSFRERIESLGKFHQSQPKFQNSPAGKRAMLANARNATLVIYTGLDQ